MINSIRIKNQYKKFSVMLFINLSHFIFVEFLIPSINISGNLFSFFDANAHVTPKSKNFYVG